MLHRSSKVDNLIKSGIPTGFNHCLFLSVSQWFLGGIDDGEGGRRNHSAWVLSALNHQLHIILRSFQSAILLASSTFSRATPGSLTLGVRADGVPTSPSVHPGEQAGV